GDSFEANAAIKAEAVARFTGLPTLADDSGLSVDALGGAPGVYSARYAGTHGDDNANNDLLLQNMAGVENRTCRFVCAMALALPGEQTHVVRGECVGELLSERSGQGGFGYDPLFRYRSGKTFAQMTEKEKNAVSHRAAASVKMREIIAGVL
ncbi:MAG: RdgB/HAM1 family non-canonical purine NTP pyrophosphatase, partial [Clostridia bacterium]|nr:RdgB/HAM1 family non-canonical purine NTP pyrophosphatase [Clostridia bacterium]